MVKSRRTVLSAFTVGLFLVMLSSTAHACIVWVGQFTITHDENGDGDTQDPYERVASFGGNSSTLANVMNYNCWTEGAIRVDVDATNVDNDGVAPSTVNLDYRAIGSQPPLPCAMSNTRDPKSGVYKISYVNTGFGDFVGGNLFGWTGTTSSRQWNADRVLQRAMVRDCPAYGGVASRWVDSEELTVTNGVGTATITIDPKPTGTNGGRGIADLPGTESAICIQQKLGTYVGVPDDALDLVRHCFSSIVDAF